MSLVEWLLSHGLPSIFVLGAIAGAVYVVRDRIGERMSKAWREVAEAHESRVKQLAGEVERQAGEIDGLKREVELLRARPDLTDAIKALAAHEVRAQDRHSALLGELKVLVTALGTHT